MDPRSDDMTPIEARIRIAADHHAFRTELAALQRLAHEVQAGNPHKYEELRVKLRQLIRALLDHLTVEDQYLAPALHAVEGWGELRARELGRHHREQRELVAQIGRRVVDRDDPPSDLVAIIASLTDQLRADMGQEDRDLLHPEVLSGESPPLDPTT